MRQALSLITLATLVTVPALYLRITGSHIELVTDTTLYGVAIVAAAFLLAWAAEAAEGDGRRCSSSSGCARAAAC